MVLYDLMEDDTALFSIIVEYLLYNRRIGQRNSWRAAETDESAAQMNLMIFRMKRITGRKHSKKYGIF